MSAHSKVMKANNEAVQLSPRFTNVEVSRSGEAQPKSERRIALAVSAEAAKGP